MLPKLEFLPTLPSLLIEPKVPFIPRDVSWLQFNERVLNEAKDGSNLWSDRLKFLGITAANLDEFFMIRFDSSVRKDSVLESVSEFVAQQSEVFEQWLGESEKAGFTILRGASLDDSDLAWEVFEKDVFPHLMAPEVYTQAHIQNVENLQTVVLFEEGRWIKIPKTIPQAFLRQQTVFFLEDLLLAFLKGPSLKPLGLVRITRNGDVAIDLGVEDPESIPDRVRSGLGKRDLGRPVRLQYSGNLGEVLLGRFAKALRLNANQVFISNEALGLSGLLKFSQELKTKQHTPSFESLIPDNFNGDLAKIFTSIEERDILLHHPYDSFDAYIRFIQAACEDPKVLSIEQTVYRMDTLSPIIDSLKKAAQTKRVRVVIELRARFDELNNLRLSDELHKAGVEVCFGFGKLKLHAKIALITRERPDGSLVRYTHLSTGNYNSTTARIYTDLAILTASEEIGSDARVFFDAVTAGQVPTGFKVLLGAPIKLHRRLLALIRVEADAARRGEPARIVAKVNALIDEQVIAELYSASQAGVRIELIVRGACSLIPGVVGLSENIKVISVVDRFLEHSRIYYFGSTKKMYLSSADWMPRNFFSRLELAFPVNDPKILEYIESILIPVYLSDTVKARELTPQGLWKKRPKSAAREYQMKIKKIILSEEARCQNIFEELARSKYKHTPLNQESID